MNAGTNNEVRKEGFGSREIATTAETHTSALVAAAQARVNARFVMALQRPRNWEDVRVRLLEECKRPGFARVARYHKPIGKGVEGASVRFAEACFRYAGNLDAPIDVTFEDERKRIVKLEVIDLETNASHGATITIDKTVERRDSTGRVVFGERKNSRGEPTYIVGATEDELLNKQNALVSKALRTCVLRLIPGDIVEEGQAVCIETARADDAKDPAAARKRLVDAFVRIGVYPKDLAAFLGHSLDAIQPAELEELREAWNTVNDGATTWAAVLEAKRGPKAGEGSAAGTPEDLEGKLREKKEAKARRDREKKDDTAKATPAAKGATSPPEQEAGEKRDGDVVDLCVTCKKPVGEDGVATWDADGAEAVRHPACKPPGLP